MILYVSKNEETSCVKMIYFNEEETGIPSELEANAKSRPFHIVVLAFFTDQHLFRYSSWWSIPGDYSRPCELSVYFFQV